MLVGYGARVTRGAGVTATFARSVQHRHQDASRVGRGREFRFEHPQTSALLVKLVNEVEDVPGVAAQTVQFHHHQLVARPDEVQDRGQLIAAVSAFAPDLFSPDDLAPGRPMYLAISFRCGHSPTRSPSCLSRVRRAVSTVDQDHATQETRKDFSTSL
jgi:hypothetical protein